ncbi:hypothetical protein RQP46_008968 [Phenoliferia psychrophenolica]
MLVEFDPARLPPLEESEATSDALADFTAALASASRVCVLTGAGISTSAGIQDFRGTTGLYKAQPPTSSASASSSQPSIKPLLSSKRTKDLFHASVYNDAKLGAQHLELMTEMNARASEIGDRHQQTPTHEFIRLLKKKGKLLRCYTQNIDGLEGAGRRRGRLSFAKLPGVWTPGSSKELEDEDELNGDVVMLHGSVKSVRCSHCSWSGPWGTEHTAEFVKGITTHCPECEKQVQERVTRQLRSRKVSSYVRPAVHLYGESSAAEEVIPTFVKADLDAQPDMLLVIGTTLQIPGFVQLVKSFAAEVKSNGGICVLVNLEPATATWVDPEWSEAGIFDYQFVSYCDSFVDRVVADWRPFLPSRNYE